MELSTNALKDYILSLEFDDVGIADASTGVAPYAAQVRSAAKDGRFGPLNYMDDSLENRLNVHNFFPQAKSIIVVLKNYYTGSHQEYGQGSGKIARYAWGKDYHQWFRKKLKLIRKHLEENHNAKTWCFNDTGPFLERAWAEKAGLGFIGKSSMLISPRLGTWTFIGGIATSLPLTPDQPLNRPDCGTCNKCIEACPTKAIIGPKMLDAKKCISTWTIERTLHPKSVSEAPRNHEWVFGCDICQEVCPFNKFQQKTLEPRFEPIPTRQFFTPSLLKEDLRGSPLCRTKSVGLLANYLRIRNTLAKKNQRMKK